MSVCVGNSAVRVRSVALDDDRRDGVVAEAEVDHPRPVPDREADPARNVARARKHGIERKTRQQARRRACVLPERDFARRAASRERAVPNRKQREARPGKDTPQQAANDAVVQAERGCRKREPGCDQRGNRPLDPQEPAPEQPRLENKHEQRKARKTEESDGDAQSLGDPVVVHRVFEEEAHPENEGYGTDAV